MESVCTWLQCFFELMLFIWSLRCLFFRSSWWWVCLVPERPPGQRSTPLQTSRRNTMCLEPTTSSIRWRYANFQSGCLNCLFGKLHPLVPIFYLLSGSLLSCAKDISPCDIVEYDLVMRHLQEQNWIRFIACRFFLIFLCRDCYEIVWEVSCWDVKWLL